MVNLIEQEKLVRNAACLGLPERVGPYQCVPLTLRKWTMLAVMESPYLPRFRTPLPEETLATLWLLSPQWLPESDLAAAPRRQQWLRANKFPFIPPLPPVFWRTRRARGKHVVAEERARVQHALLTAELRDYILETLQDAPQGGPAAAIAAPEYYCDAVAIATQLARDFGGGLAHYFDLPLKLVFQAMKERTEYHALRNGQPVTLNNPSDAIADAELEAANRALHASGKPLHSDVKRYLEQQRN